MRTVECFEGQCGRSSWQIDDDNFRLRLSLAKARQDIALVDVAHNPQAWHFSFGSKCRGLLIDIRVDDAGPVAVECSFGADKESKGGLAHPAFVGRDRDDRHDAFTPKSSKAL